MTFFNKKTDVMDIELTPYGRYLLSIGKLKPKYYEFTDEDILYNVSASAQLKTETQENAHNRIMHETPRMRTLYLKKGIGHLNDFDYGNLATTSTRFPSVNISIDNIREEQQDISHNQKGVYAMGRSSYTADKTPGLQLTMLRGQISSSLNYLSSSFVDSFQIPQIEYEYLITKTTGIQINDPSENYDFTTEIRPDGTYDKLQFEIPIMHAKEFNSFYEKENFDLEVFMVVEDPPDAMIQGLQDKHGRKKRLYPLKFMKKQNAIIDDMLIVDDLPSEYDQQDAYEFATDYVEHYFKIQVDREIPDEELCEVVDSLEINDQFIDEELICPERRTERFDIYTSRVGPEDLEDCD